MFSLETMNIDLKAIKDGSTSSPTGDRFEASYLLDDEYFSCLNDAEIKSGRVNTTVSIRKAAGGEFAMTIAIEGSVTVQCDRCLEDMEQPVKAESSYIVKLGQEPDETDDIIVVDEAEGILHPAWLIYESIALAVPTKHVHAPGKCNSAMTQKLKELSATRSGDESAEDVIDPRWNALKSLKV